MRTTRRHTLISAAGALLTLLGLVIGVPLALWALAGSPVPASLPSLSEVVSGLTQGPIADSTIVKGIAIIGWLAWLQITLSVIVETVAWGRGLSAPNLFASGPIQPAVRRLIATAALLLSSPTMAAATVPSPAVAVVQELVVVPQAANPDLVAMVPIAFDTTTAAIPHRPALKFQTVQHRDTLWDLAENHLGDAFRWPELYELNKGCIQADGGSLQDPNLIVTGWQLEFPADAVGVEPVAAVAAPVVPETVPTTSAADEPDPMEGPDTEVAPTNTATPATTAAVAAPEPAATPTTLNQNAATSSAPERGDRSSVTEPPNDVERSETSRALVFLVGGGLLAASIVVLINRLRSIRTRNRRTPKPLSDQLQRTELQLRHGADVEGASRLDLALRALATGLRSQDGPPISVMAVRLLDGDIDVLLDQPASTAPKGFESTGNPRGWQLRAELSEDELRKLANGATAPLPSLVTIGLGDSAPVLIDIETAGIITIGGDADLTMPYLRRIATELTTSTWTDHLDLITVGEPLGGIARSQRVRHFDDPEEAVHQLLLIATATAEQLINSDHTNTLEARIADDHGDGWIPTILISSEPLSDALTDRLAVAVAPGRGVGVIAPGAIPTNGWHANLTGGHVTLAPHNMTLDAVVLEPETAEAIDQILTDLTIDPPVDHEADSDAADPDFDGTFQLDDLEASEPVVAFEEKPAEVEFRVLGGIDVVGIGPVERRKSMEIGTYLALHSPEGVTDDRVKMVFWPDEPPSKETFNTTMSMTRSALGTDSTGELLLPHYATTHQRYRVTNTVTTDLARFEARAVYAKTVPPAFAKPVLEEALGMVRGQPFDVSRGYEWAFAESFVTRAAIAIAEAAQRLGEIALDDGDSTTAEWAATRGLLAAPGDEGLYRIRMRAAKASGNTSVIRQILNELCESVEANEPYDQLDPKTIELFENLTGKSARTLTVVRNRG
jgi:DNA-binding SARP family transcriptional activator